MQKLLTAALVLAVLLVSCWDLRKRPPSHQGKISGYKAVYSTDSSLLRVAEIGPQPVKFAGKIYVKDNLIFQNDLGYGIHVINNTDPATASRIGFIRVLGSSEMSIKGNYLYVNSFSDLVVVDISDWQHVSEVKRVKNAFTQGGSVGYHNYTFIPLPEHKVYYECNYYNEARVQTGWVKDSIPSYSCYYP